MILTFDSKIKSLEQEKSELDLAFLENKKIEYEEKMYEILDNTNDLEENNAISELNKAKSYRSKIKEINKKIQYNSEFLENINAKISFYTKKKNRIKSMPLYRDTEERIAEIIGSLYLYAKETGKDDLAKSLMQRSLTPEGYSQHLENMYTQLFTDALKKKEKKITETQEKKARISLPEGMSEQINEELKNDKNITPQEIESFLKKELKKNNGEIKISHIKNTFKNNYLHALEYIKRLIINYLGFKIIDNLEEKNITPTQSKRDKLISSISKEEAEERKNERLKKSNLSFKLEEIGKIKNLKFRISKYLDLFQELECIFADRENFESLMFNVISTYTHIEIEKDIIKTLNGLIQGNFHIEKTGLYKYHVYKFNRDSWRMLAYPNGEIFTICSHEEYEKIIDTQPPIDKVE